MASAVETLIRSTVAKGITSLASYNRRRMRAPAKPNPYLAGIHKPMTGELTLSDLAVTGTIPPDLDGRYIRIGPNPAEPPNPASYHWFIGDGMVHGVRIKAGRALWYRNRWIRSKAVSAALGEPPAPGPRHRNFDTVNTNVLGHGGATWALVEAGGYPVRINEELETIAHDPFGGTLTGSFTAHPHRDPETGELHAVCYDATEQNIIRHVVVGRDGLVRRQEPVPVKNGPSIHDCMITKNYVVILDLPVTFSMKRLVEGYQFPFIWNTAHKARVGLLPREGVAADMIWCDVEPCYVFHACNAYETGDGRVVLDVCAHDRMFAESTQGPDSDRAPFERWTVSIKGRQVTRQVVDPEPQEFPRFNETRTGKPYRYAYAMSLGKANDTAVQEQSQLFKHDLETGRREVHDFGPGHVPGEFVFVPRPGALQEDAGWMMGYVVDRAAETTGLVILDAARFEEAPVATIHIPHRIPAGFHGNWVPTEM